MIAATQIRVGMVIIYEGETLQGAGHRAHHAGKQARQDAGGDAEPPYRNKLQLPVPSEDTVEKAS
jgi:hypothetical protein